MSYKWPHQNQQGLSLSVAREGLIHDVSKKIGLQAHIDWKSIRDNLEAIKTNVSNRNSSADPQKVADLYDRWRSLQTQAEDLRTERNANAKSMKVPIATQQA